MYLVVTLFSIQWTLYTLYSILLFYSTLEWLQLRGSIKYLIKQNKRQHVKVSIDARNINVYNQHLRCLVLLVGPGSCYNVKCTIL